jgi:FkbM family methyltransferase
VDSVVVDGGAHRGEFCREIHSRFGCRCVLVEANPLLAAQLQPPPRGKAIHGALAATDGSARFIFRDNPEGGGIAPLSYDRNNPNAKVQMFSLATLSEKFALSRVDLLKLDIEGAEFALLSETPDSVLAAIEQISVEFHDFLPEFKQRGLFEAARSRLESLGFACLPMAFRTHGDVLFLNRRRVGISDIKLWSLAIGGRWVLKLREAGL